MGENYKLNSNCQKLIMKFNCYMLLFFLLIISFWGCSIRHSSTITGKQLPAERNETKNPKQSQSVQSEKSHREALVLKETALGAEHPEVTVVLNNFAGFLYEQGEYERAKSLYDRALSIDEKAFGPEHPEVAKDLNNIAGLCYAMGEYARARTFYEHALAIDEKNYGSDHPDIARNLNNLAEVYHILGENNTAEALYERAMEIYKNTYGLYHPETATVLNNLAVLYKETGEYRRSEMLFEQALAIRNKINGHDHPETSTILNNLAGLLYARGEYDRAKSLYDRALAIDEKAFGPEHPKTAIRQNNIAEVYFTAGDYSQARPLYERALVTAQKKGYPEILWKVQFNLANLLAAQTNPGAAVFFAKQAVNTIQKLRSGISHMEKHLQKSFLTNKVHVYRFLADLLIDQGRLLEAQQILDMQKEEEYFEFIRRNAVSRGIQNSFAAYTDEERPWEERYQQINTHIAALGREMTRLKQKKQSERTDDETQRIEQVKDDLKVARLAFSSFMSEVIESLGRVTRQRYAEISTRRLDKPKKLQQALRELGHNAVVIYYLITDDKVRIILITPEVQVARDKAIPEKILNHKIMDFRRVLQKPRLSPFSLARELYEIVFAPIEDDLIQAEARTLMLCLDGALRYLPVAALHDGKNYVAERYQIALYTPAAGLDIKDLPSETWRVGGFGLSRAVSGFKPLPSVPAELEGIVRTNSADPDGVMPGVIFLDEEFNKKTMEAVLEEQYPVIHIASHFELRPGTTKNSYLILGDGNMLSLEQIKNDDFDFGGVELITLSACNTALGNTGADGSEVESFGTLVQDQGAKGVMATLWPVSDKSTGVFMKNMYQLREEKGMTKAEALQQAQILFVLGPKKEKNNNSFKSSGALVLNNKKRHEKVSFTPDPNAPYAHPYYWAPFVLMGNWL